VVWGVISLLRGSAPNGDLEKSLLPA
jgi:hypothetical protein